MIHKITSFCKAAILISLLMVSHKIHAQSLTGEISGRVKTSDDKPAAGVTIKLKEAGRSTSTDEEGSFSFKKVKEGTYTLSVTFIGKQSQLEAVKVLPGRVTTEEFILHETQSQLAEVVVTGRNGFNEQPLNIGKMPVKPIDMPQSTAIISSNIIAQQQSMRLSDVIKNVNGVYLGTTRGSTQESFYARGYSFSSNNIFKNGSRVNSGAMPEMSSLERVEVLKGSAAILYGNVAPGGIVNLVTKQPKFEQGGEVSMRIGSYDLYKPVVDVYGPISSTVAYRINGTYEDAGSFRNNVSSERYYFNPSVLFKLGTKTDLIVQGDYLNHEYTPDFGTGAIAGRIADVPRDAYLGASWSNGDTKQATASASLNHRLNKVWQLNAIASYQFYKRDYYATERIQPEENGDWERPLGRSRRGENYYSAQVNLTGTVSTGAVKHTLLAGLDADHTLSDNYTYQSAVYDKINILDPDKYPQRTDIPQIHAQKIISTPVNNYGIYINDLMQLSPKINLLAGLRWSYQEALRAETTDLTTQEVSKGEGQNDNAFSPRLGLVYKPVPTTALFVSYANSFNINSGTDVYGNTLKPSLVDQYEIGIKNDFFKEMLSANVTVYRIINHNLAQTAPFLADGITPNTNTSFKELTGQTISDGVELDIAGHPAPGLDIIAGYSYNYMRYTETPDAPGNNIEGERLVNSPAHTANASVFYTFKSADLKGLRLGASANYVGERYGGWNNKSGQTQTESRLIPVSGFSTFDFSAGYSYKKLSLLAKVSNLTNTLNYYVHENYSINPIPPRQFVTTVAYRF